MKLIDLTGKRYGRLLVIHRDEDYISPKGKRHVQWCCLCDCGEKITIQGNRLKSGCTKSCGCLRTEIIKQPRQKKLNKYDLSGEYGIGYTSKGEEFYFDLEDYDKIKDYTWHINSDGYVETWKIGFMHKFIMNITDNEICVDHIHGFETRNDNRKLNLRVATYSQNAINIGLRKNNTSGVTGVYFSKNDNIWRAFISVNNKKVSLGSFKKFEDAVQARKEGEEKYYKEYSYDYSQNISI